MKRALIVSTAKDIKMRFPSNHKYEDYYLVKTRYNNIIYFISNLNYQNFKNEENVRP